MEYGRHLDIPLGYDLISDGICTFIDNDKIVIGQWYINEETDMYFFLIDDNEDKNADFCFVEDGNIFYDSDEVLLGWFSKTTDCYTPVSFPDDSDDVSFASSEEDDDDGFH